MRVVMQRAKNSKVSVDGITIGAIEHGLVVFLGVENTDTLHDVDYLARKIARIRIFPDEDGKMNRSILDVQGQILLISQFTLFGDAHKGNRPSFVQAADPVLANQLYQSLINALEQYNIVVETGQFQQQMSVSLINEGPVTIIMDSNKKF